MRSTFKCLCVLGALVALPAMASPFSIGKSGPYEKMQCDGGSCNWFEWEQQSIHNEGEDVIVKGRGKIALSEFEERRKGGERFVDQREVRVVVRCSLTTPSVEFNGEQKSVDLTPLVTPVSSVYFRVCHGIAPASAKKFQSIIDKNYAD